MQNPQKIDLLFKYFLSYTVDNYVDTSWNKGVT